jgi:hypothetical protein
MLGVNLGDYPNRNKGGHFFLGEGEMVKQIAEDGFHSFHTRYLQAIRPICGQKSSGWK